MPRMTVEDDDDQPAERIKVVPERATVRVTARGALHHLCPHKDETDEGQVEIEWTCRSGVTIELHSLRDYLDQFRDVKISHEALTDRIADDLQADARVSDVTVISHWATGGFAVTVRSAGAMSEARVRL